MARTTTKEKSYRIQIVNIKLLSNNRRGDTAYMDIIQKMHSNKVSISVRGTTHMILRTQFSDKVTVQDKEWEIIYGKISKYTVINGKDWLNMNSMEVENVDLPVNMFPNLKETEYIFIPGAHRFAIVNTSSVNVYAVAKFLSGAIKEVINTDEELEVCIEQSEDVFEQIIQAEEVRKLFIDISYSNADTGDEAYSFMDNQLKDGDIQRLKMEASPNQNGNIKTNGTLILGALRVAQSNGYATATIMENGKRKQISTNEHPRIIPVTCEETLLKSNVVARIINLFRKHSN